MKVLCAAIALTLLVGYTALAKTQYVPGWSTIPGLRVEREDYQEKRELAEKFLSAVIIADNIKPNKIPKLLKEDRMVQVRLAWHYAEEFLDRGENYRWKFNEEVDSPTPPNETNRKPTP